MKGMKSAQEYQFVVPPAGTYRTKVVTATDKTSRSGNTMLEIGIEILEPEAFAGVSVKDWIGTDGTTDFGRMGKKKLRGLGIDVDASDDEIPDSQLAHSLLGREVWTTVKQEPRMEESVKGSGKYDKPAYDTVDGKLVPRMQLKVDSYGGVITHMGRIAPQTQAAPQAAPQYPQQGQVQQFQQQFAPPAQHQVAAHPPQYAQQYQQPQQQFAPPQGQPPQGFQQVPPGPQFPQFANGGNGAALPPWMAQAQQQGVPGAQPQAEDTGAEPKKRGKKAAN